MRNQFYYDIMTQPGVKNPARAYTGAPGWLRAAADEAFTYGVKGTAADIIPDDHVAAYESGKGSLSVKEAERAISLIRENVPI